jgi:hypothetical protein
VELDLLALSERLDIFIFVFGTLHPSGIPAGFRFQLEKGVNVLDEMFSLDCLGAILCHLVFVKFVDFEYEVTTIDSDPHFVHDPRACKVLSDI